MRNRTGAGPGTGCNVGYFSLSATGQIIYSAYFPAISGQTHGGRVAGGQFFRTGDGESDIARSCTK